MKKQLLSWAPNQTYTNKWDRLALTSKGCTIAAWVWRDEDDTFSSSIMNLDGPGEALLTKTKFDTIESAKQFADQELKRQGFNY